MINNLSSYFYLGWRKILEIILDLFDYLYIKIYLAIILFINLSNWTIAKVISDKTKQDLYISQYSNSDSVKDLFILHYNVDFGINLVGRVERVYIMPLFGLLILIINLFLLLYFYKNNKFISHLLLTSVFLVNVFLLMALASIYLINFRPII
ncbi:hypothetical protein CO115_05235 [Candidatus Falkowbacteria bacterium CG_4_9_14_3_um_filter_36_9]|uniref:Uncharacterized protein n=2 Tax=Candidatus Falkowiibacteriota TaxID=1752728 RepID=A0A1J4T8W4_9BACT|nr:MAG: hypothetical protein AUJ27_01540 [Candidatus Falkowbacteria bacterium CG1_02_37_44]PIV50247.1 MAG: hypothetical protein COS18_05580 [Candidatus Falkowbacteria bacterium CG02_land_8_20_14_3_00_36_14]PIX11814.1 MAG: hypothetical protein COZ73_01825 [Candidatus Falkowbacteria bacterium CG_4_8_14_3_um_filter_36_11]PJA10787.1 MAG: hypothetical protein COX67_03205 [Candidatus Falkowbacteria bacterium CG_4_10_14_0_2_um_filter_36_22]PJB17936.1 MAG: hypothetical protein CO115_05235 [Candidatus F